MQKHSTKQFDRIYLFDDLDFPEPDLLLPCWLFAILALHSIACSLYEDKFITAPQTTKLKWWWIIYETIGLRLYNNTKEVKPPNQTNGGVKASYRILPSQFVDWPLVLDLSFFFRKNSEPRFRLFSGWSAYGSLENNNSLDMFGAFIAGFSTEKLAL